MNVNLHYFSLMREIHSYSSLSDVKVKLHPADEQVEGKPFVPHAEIGRGGVRTLHLLRPEYSWSPAQIMLWRGDFYHELSHFDEDVADYYELMNVHNLDPDKFYGFGMNILEDYRVERNKLGTYTGRDMCLSYSYAERLKMLLQSSMSEEMVKLDGKGDASIITAVSWLATHCREDFQPEVNGLSAQFESLLSKEMRAKLDEMRVKGIPDKLRAVKTAEDEKVLWDEILTIFERDSDEEEKQGQAEERGGAGDGEGAGAASGGAGSGDSDGDDESSMADDRPNEGEAIGKKRAEKDAKINWKDLSTHPHDQDEKPSFSRLDIDYTGYQNAKDDFPLAIELDVRDYVNNTGSVRSTPSSSYMRKTESACTHTGLANKVRKLLQVKTQTLTIQGQKKGKLSTKSMHRVAMHGVGKYRERVFKKKIQQYDLDTAVSVVVDFSGSMGGSRMQHAIISAIMLNEAISKIGVPLEIVGFTDSSDRSVMSVLKTFDKKISNEQLRINCCKAAQSMSSNADGEAVLWAYHRLTRQASKRKLMIVLSDGQPACYRPGIFEFTQDVVNRIQQEKRAEIYGIGIESTAVKHFYKHNAVINSPNDLEEAVIKVIKNHILS